MQFQKIFIPSLEWKVIGNSKMEGSLKSQNFKGKYMDEAKLEFLEGWPVPWGVQTKNVRGKLASMRSYANQSLLFIPTISQFYLIIIIRYTFSFVSEITNLSTYGNCFL